MSKPKVKEIDIIADDIDPQEKAHLKVQKGARGIVLKEQDVLLLYYEHKDFYTLPGGGIQTGETPLEALKREVLEETGYTVLDASPTLVLNETFADSRWQHHFFKCEIAAQKGSITLTPEEKAFGLTVVFKPLKEALELLSFHEPKTYHPHLDHIQKRELLGLIHSL